MSVVLDRIQGANAWLTVGMREGKNREIRRAMSAINLTVNRLIRVSYGPFRLGDLKPGQVEEVKAQASCANSWAKGQTDDEDRPDGPAPPQRSPATPRPNPTEPNRKSRPPKGPRPHANAPAPLKPGEGLKQLSQAWQKATRPRSGAAKAQGSRPLGPDQTAQTCARLDPVKPAGPTETRGIIAAYSRPWL